MYQTSSADVFWSRQQHGLIEFAITDARTDLGDQPESSAEISGNAEWLTALSGAFGVSYAVAMRQVHGTEVALAKPGDRPTADALVTSEPGVGVVVRVADCTPIVIADLEGSVVSVVHAGRQGMVDGVVMATVAQLRDQGATELHAWIGPRACGKCYELPADMVDQIARAEPTSRSETSWGTPAIDVGAAVAAQLLRSGVTVTDIGRGHCTIEDSRFHSYRRQQQSAGRFGVIAAIRGG